MIPEELEKVLSIVNKIYDLGKLTVLKKVEAGFLSNNFILKGDKDKYFLRQYRFDDTEKIKEIHLKKFFFAKNGIPVILPLPTKKGDLIFDYQDKYYSLFPFAEGKIMKKGALPDTAIVSMAETLAHIHLLSKNDCPPISNNKERKWETEKFLEDADSILKIIEKKTKKDSFDNLAVKAIKLKMSLARDFLDKKSSPKLKNDHIVHGDYHNLNIFFEDSGHVKYVFDIEVGSNSNRVFELLRSIDLSFFDGGYSRDRFTKALLYLRSYNRIYPLDKGEIRDAVIFYHTKNFHSLWVERAHYLNDSNRVDVFLEKEYERLRYFTKNLNEFIKTLRSELV